MPFPMAYVGRHPKPKDLLGKVLYGIGSVLRGTGNALDSVGSSIQGPYGVQAELPPNTAWLPLIANPQVKGAGKISEVASRPDLKDAPKVSIVEPVKGPDVFVAQSATILGNVSIGKGSSIWYGATLRELAGGGRARGQRARLAERVAGLAGGGCWKRASSGSGSGDVNAITIGERTNIQDNVVIHVARHVPSTAAPRATVIGSNVTVAHGALVHAATIGDGCLVGMGATLLDGVTLEPGSVVAAGAVVPPGAVVKTGQIWAGAPAKLLRTVSAEEASFLVQSADNYAKLAQAHKTENGKVFEELVLDATIAGERAWREKTDSDVHQGIYRDPQTQVLLSMR